MITRRLLVPLLATAFVPGRLYAQESVKNKIEQAFEIASGPETLGPAPLPLSDARWTQAAELMDLAPTSGAPFEVASYLSTLPAEFVSEWPTAYANPLIMLLFAATNTTPSGDQTPWCAAFVSWCVERVGLTSKHSASSQAYRSFNSETWSPGRDQEKARRGDLCVFTKSSDPRFGHVGFFENWVGLTKVRVLGGNQSNAIGYNEFRTEGSMPLTTIRSVE